MTRSTTGAAIVGIGRTPIWRRGESSPRSELELVGTAMLSAIADAGLTVDDVDGFAYYSTEHDTALIAQVLGIPEVRFTAGLTGGGGGSAGSLGLAAAAVTSGMAETVVVVRALQQGKRRLGAAFSPTSGNPTAESDFYLTAGLIGPGQMFAPVIRRHMHQYGTTREHLAEIVMVHRENAMTREGSIRTRQLTLDEYLETPLISDPLCRHDFCVESDLAGAVVVTSAERAKDLPHHPVQIAGSAHGGEGRWGMAETWLNMPDELFPTAGHQGNARQLFGKTGLRPQDVDAAMIYDNFSSNVLLQLEDYGFCEVGEGGSFVAGGAIRASGSLPVNTHGGQLAEAFLGGFTHIIEGVEQLRRTAVNQVEDAEVVLVTGGAAAIPTSGALLTR